MWRLPYPCPPVPPWPVPPEPGIKVMVFLPLRIGKLKLAGVHVVGVDGRQLLQIQGFLVHHGLFACLLRGPHLGDGHLLARYGVGAEIIVAAAGARERAAASNLIVMLAEVTSWPALLSSLLKYSRTHCVCTTSAGKVVCAAG